MKSAPAKRFPYITSSAYSRLQDVLLDPPNVPAAGGEGEVGKNPENKIVQSQNETLDDNNNQRSLKNPHTFLVIPHDPTMTPQKKLSGFVEEDDFPRVFPEPRQQFLSFQRSATFINPSGTNYRDSTCARDCLQLGGRLLSVMLFVLLVFGIWKFMLYLSVPQGDGENSF